MPARRSGNAAPAIHGQRRLGRSDCSRRPGGRRGRRCLARGHRIIVKSWQSGRFSTIWHASPRGDVTFCNAVMRKSTRRQATGQESPASPWSPRWSRRTRRSRRRTRAPRPVKVQKRLAPPLGRPKNCSLFDARCGHRSSRAAIAVPVCTLRRTREQPRAKRDGKTDLRGVPAGRSDTTPFPSGRSARTARPDGAQRGRRRRRAAVPSPRRGHRAPPAAPTRTYRSGGRAFRAQLRPAACSQRGQSSSEWATLEQDLLAQIGRIAQAARDARDADGKEIGGKEQLRVVASPIGRRRGRFRTSSRSLSD